MRPTIVLRKSIFAIITLFLCHKTLHAECIYQQIITGEELSVGIMLNWSTKLEKENAMFIIERSEDGIQFTNIGAVKGAGYSTDNKVYSYLDNSTPTGQRYYRLRQIDFNGIFETSPIFVFNKFAATHFAISSLNTNSTAGSVEVQFDSIKEGVFEFELTDWQGRSLLVDTLDVIAGTNSITINLSKYNTLIYQLTLKAKGQEQTITFRIKQ